MKNIKMKCILSCLSIFLTVIVAEGATQEYDTVITGQGNSDYDIKAVQDAVDKGGTVLLKGKFDFGKDGSVIIQNDIKIFGEINNEGKYLTKISGGHWTFHSTFEKSLPDGPGPKIAIQGIHFDGAYYTPLCFCYTSGTEIIGNKITNVIPHKVQLYVGKSILWQAGAVLGTQFIRGWKMTVPGAVTGKLVFHKNQVDLRNDKPKDTLGQGVYFQKTWGATIEISDNIFTNVSRNAIECLDNSLDKEGRGMILIRNNRIITPKIGCSFPSPTSYPNGIMVGWFLDPSGGVDPSRNPKILIMRNFVQTNGEKSAGISSGADGTSIIGNRVEVKGGSKSKAITQQGSNGFIARNKIDGTGAWALRALPYSSHKGSGNIFAWNDVKEFKASSAVFLCTGNKNTIIGKRCNVVDKGQGNKTFFE